MDLERFFSNFGLVRETRIVKNENGITKGYFANKNVSFWKIQITLFV